MYNELNNYHILYNLLNLYSLCIQNTLGSEQPVVVVDIETQTDRVTIK